MGWFNRLTEGLQKTRQNLIGKVQQAIFSYQSIEPELLEDVEELLVTSDMGVDVSMEIIENIKRDVEENGHNDPEYVWDSLQSALQERLAGAEGKLTLRDDDQPTVILVMGVNGSGKTTTIAKLGQKFRNQNKEIVLAASDTFRAAAIEQLQAWASKIDATLIRHELGADPSAVAYDALDHTINTDSDVLMIDTAGRLQTKHNLMEELKKINRVLEKRLGRSIDERLLTIDATNGQNGISQAEKFNSAVSLTGIVLTKLDGTAKGGVIFPIVSNLDVPIKFIGVGEGEQDLHSFDKDQFIDALFETE